MGIYNIPAEELVDSLEQWLREQEGNVQAETLAEAYNTISKREGWEDRLTASAPWIEEDGAVLSLLRKLRASQHEEILELQASQHQEVVKRLNEIKELADKRENE